MSNRLDEEFREEMRQDMLIDAYNDEMEEIKIRNDDDFFYDAITDKFGGEISSLVIDIEKYCGQYDRDVKDWIAILMEK